MKQNTIIKLVEWALRINVFLKLTIYGLGKILGGQFYTKGNIPEAIAKIPLGETNGYDLAWTFFGHSKPYILFIGISQLIGALLIVINRTKLLGGAILAPILLNIIVVDYFFGVAYGAMFSACFYLASVLFMFYVSRVQVADALRRLLIYSTNKKERKQQIIQVAIIIVGLAVVFFVEYFFINYFGYEDRYY
ncbi:MAG: hypothetical protein AAF489_09390 [Bacteroidota bacterium]